VMSCTGVDSTCVIRDVTLTGGLAAGFWPSNAGGGMYFENASPRIIGCVFDGNSAGYGGGLACKDAFPRLTGCTFADNSGSSDGGGLYVYHNSDLTLENTIVTSSVAGQGIRCYYYSTASLSCCDVYGNAGGDWTGEIEDQLGVDGNICADPCFCEPYTGHVAVFSPCAPDQSLGCGLIGALGVGCEYTDAAVAAIEVPRALYLGPAVPNPFNPVTEISYGIPPSGARSRVEMNVYDALGRRVRTLVDTDLPPGTYRAVWDGTDEKGVAVASGVYFYRLVWNGKSETRRMVLLK